MTAEKKLELLNGIDSILNGIDRLKDEKPFGGWWTTNIDADFGEKKLEELKTFVLKKMDEASEK